MKSFCYSHRLKQCIRKEVGATAGEVQKTEIVFAGGCMSVCVINYVYS